MTAQSVYRIYTQLDFWKQKIDEYLQRKKKEDEYRKQRKKRRRKSQ